MRPCVAFVDATEDDLPASLPETMARMARKYRTIYAEKGLHDKHGFRVNKLSKKAKRVNAILELFYEIDEDHTRLARRAAAEGWETTFPTVDEHDVSEDGDSSEEAREDKSRENADLTLQESGEDPEKRVDKSKRVWRSSMFALTPQCKHRRRFVRIDSETFTTVITKKYMGGDFSWTESPSRAFLSLFHSNGKRSSLQLRSKSKGFVIGKSFVTDGTAVCIPFFNSRREKAAHEKRSPAPIVVTDHDLVASIDPGRANLMMAAIPDAYGRTGPSSSIGYDFLSLTREDIIRDSGQLAAQASRESRVSHHAKVALEELSATRRRTHDPEEILRHVQACSRNAGSLERAYMCRKSSAERFQAYAGKRSVVDRTLRRLKPQKFLDDKRLVVSIGDASVAPTGRGERSVPTLWMWRHLARCKGHLLAKHPDSPDTTTVIGSTAEYNTTKMCCQCHTPLTAVRRWHTFKDGSRRLITDRDVRVCENKRCLESHPASFDPLELHPSLHRGDLRREFPCAETATPRSPSASSREFLGTSDQKLSGRKASRIEHASQECEVARWQELSTFC